MMAECWALAPDSPSLTQTQITQSFDHRRLNTSIHQAQDDEGVGQKHNYSTKIYILLQIGLWILTF